MLSTICQSQLPTIELVVDHTCDSGSIATDVCACFSGVPFAALGPLDCDVGNLDSPTGCVRGDFPLAEDSIGKNSQLRTNIGALEHQCKAQRGRAERTICRRPPGKLSFVRDAGCARNGRRGGSILSFGRVIHLDLRHGRRHGPATFICDSNAVVVLGEGSKRANRSGCLDCGVRGPLAAIRRCRDQSNIVA